MNVIAVSTIFRNEGFLLKFNDRLLDLRKRRGLSQDELGEDLNTSRQTISKWENSISYPDFHRLILFSDFFNVSLDGFMKGEQIVISHL